MLTTAQLKGWGQVQWQTQIKHVAPSEGGAVGVMFCWCRNPSNELPSYNRVSTADFVVKPSAGSAATTKLAEKVMVKAVGSASVNTLPIQKNDPRFNALLSSLARARQHVNAAAASASGPSATAMATLKARWDTVFMHYQNADALMVQDMASGMHEFDRVMHDPSQGVGALLGNRALMENLGRLFAVDAVLGNGDRLCSMNGGNIVFKSDGQIYTVDSQAILISYQGLLSTGSFTVKQWVEQILNANTGAQLAEKPLQVQAPSFAMEKLYDVDHWWQLMFRGHLEYSMHQHGETSPSEPIWQWARIWFKNGVDQGLAAVDAQLSGFNWFKLKNTFKSYEKKYGASINLDWTNLKIRRMYVRMVMADRNKPGTPAEKQSAAFARVLDYAQRKVGAPVIA